MKHPILFFTSLCFATPAFLATDPTPVPIPQNFAAMRAQVEALAGLTVAPKCEVVERGDATPNLKPILYSGHDFHGQPNKVFAWLGLPEKREGKVPVVVSVHGGGGTASKAWVQRWNNHGYAAISMSLEGQTDTLARLPDGGPPRRGIFADSAAPINDQWMYQPVADATLAAAPLRSLQEVDPGKTGIVGCSWEGINTAMVICIDPQYASAIPVYGCGGLSVIPNQHGGEALWGSCLANNGVYKKVLDDFNATKPLESATLISTADIGHTGGRKWIGTTSTLSRKDALWDADAAVPIGTTACFLYVKS